MRRCAELASEAVASEGGDPAAITEVGAPESYASSEESEQSRSDSTSEDDGAIDLSELLDVRELVYFNYSGMTPTSAPTSLRVSVPHRLSMFSHLSHL